MLAIVRKPAVRAAARVAEGRSPSRGGPILRVGGRGATRTRAGERLRGRNERRRARGLPVWEDGRELEHRRAVVVENSTTSRRSSSPRMSSRRRVPASGPPPSRTVASVRTRAATAPFDRDLRRRHLRLARPRPRPRGRRRVLLRRRGASNAFTVAFQVPNLVRALVADAALSSAFVPVFSDLLREGRAPRAWRVASSLVLAHGPLGLTALTALFVLVARG